MLPGIFHYLVDHSEGTMSHMVHVEVSLVVLQ